MIRFYVLCLVAISAFPLEAEEVQSHGFTFEQQVWNHMFGRGYTDDWDIPGSANLQNPGVPISVKYIQWKNSVYLGDAVRQRSIDEPFEMIVGFYQKEGDAKTTLALHQLHFTPEQWKALWGTITVADLEAFGEKIKQGTIQEAQDYARPHAAELRKKSGIFSINPKINKDQRRIQCSIPFTVFYREVVKQQPERQEKITLWGRELR